jgi:hypothetical protein
MKHKFRSHINVMGYVQLIIKADDVFETMVGAYFANKLPLKLLTRKKSFPGSPEQDSWLSLLELIELKGGLWCSTPPLPWSTDRLAH